LVVTQERIHAPRQTAGAIKLIFGIGKVIGFVSCPQATFVKRTVMGNQWDICKSALHTPAAGFLKVGRV
jgi:hypothetical protein